MDVNLDELDREDLLLASEQVLGNCAYRLTDIVFVKPDVFDHARTREMAAEMDVFNQTLVEQRRPYLLIGPGRWGSSDPWLGIPVKFTSISGASAIVETSLPNMLPDPSQGSHFFQNLTSFRIAYFTTRHYNANHHIDWDWLNSLPVVSESVWIKHVRSEHELEVAVDGHTGHGVVLKKARVKEEGS
jgi:hypothetical protein